MDSAFSSLPTSNHAHPSDVDKAGGAGGTQPLPAVSQVRQFSLEAHWLVHKCFSIAEPKPGSVRWEGSLHCLLPILHPIGG